MSMDIYSPPGTKVTFLDRNGTELDRAEAERILKVGQIYIIESINVGSWRSDVTLEEIPNKTFNSVMFDNIRLA
ncbi:MAG: hypothetical protein ACXAC5_05515 [Promethearchaeota archaeon]|jgi:hypothetical protein